MCRAARSRPIDEVFANPQVQHERLARTVEHPTIGPLTVPGMPYHLRTADLEVTLPPPLLGEHTDAILHELGFDDGGNRRHAGERRHRLIGASTGIVIADVVRRSGGRLHRQEVGVLPIR